MRAALRLESLYWFHAANAFRETARPSAAASVHHPIIVPVLKFVLPMVKIASYHPGGEITQPAHDNVFSFYEQND
ncbi:hypothetical protein [Raoultella sp. T31]|uniref:hypothetical protein n=1 Tax=Raoultella sp. T31 TaxID=2054594 RepID=UPI001054A24A